MITARQLIFYIRAEDQASRVVRRAASSFGSLSNIQQLQNRASQQQIRNMRNLEQAQLAIMRNQTAIQRGEAQAARLGTLATSRLKSAGISRAQALQIAATQREELLSGQLPRGTTAAVSAVIGHEAALSNLDALQKRNELLSAAQEDVRRTGAAASAAIEKQISLAEIARIDSYINGVQGVARAFRLIAVAAAASLGFAAHAAAQFGTQVTLAATQSTVAGRNTTAQVLRNSAVLQKQIILLEQSGKVTSSFADQTQAAYQIFSSVTLRGNQNEQLRQGINLLRQFNQVATANFGMVDLNAVTKAGIVLMNRFHVSVQQMPAALNRMQAAVRFGALNMGQFVAGFNQVAPAFKAAGYSFNNMAGTMAFISRMFPNVAMGFTGLARLTETLSNKKIVDGLKAQGVEITNTTGHLLPLDQILGRILAKFPQLQQGGTFAANFFKTIGGLQSTVQARRAFISLIQNLPQYRRMLRDVIGDNNELAKSWKAMQQSPQVQWTEFTNKLKAVVYEIGIYAIPAITDLGRPIGNLVKWFDGLSEHTKKLIAQLTVFGSVATIIVGTIIIFGGAAAKLALTVKELRLMSLAGEAGEMRAAFALLPPVLIGVAVLLNRYPNILHTVTKGFGGLHGVIKTVTVILGVLAGMKLASWFAGLELGAVRAAAQITILQRELAALVSLSPYIITVAVLYEPIKHLAQQFRKDHPGVAKIADAFPVAGPVFEAGGEVGTRAGKAFDNWLARIYPTWKQKVDQMHAKMRKDAMTPETQIQITAMQAPTVLQTILTSRMASDFDKAQARLAFIKKDYAELSRILKSVTLPQVTTGEYTLDKVGKKVVQVAKSNAWQQLFDKVIRLDKLVQSQKVPTLKSLEALLNAEDALQKASTGNQYQAAQQMLSALEQTWNTAEKSATKHSKNLLKIEKQNVQNAKTELGNLLQGVQSLYDNYLQQNQTMFGDLFAGPVIQGARVQDKLQFGGQITGTDLLRDIKAQVFQFNRINRQINTLAKRGAPKEFLDQIRAMGPSAKDDIKALQQLTPQQFRQYISAWNSGQKAIKANTMKQLNSQLKVYESYGKNIARAILKGVQSENQALQKALQKVILRMFPGLAKQAKEGFKPEKIPKTPPATHKLPAYAVAPKNRRTLQSASINLPTIVRGATQLMHPVTNTVNHTSTTNHSLNNHYQVNRNTIDNRRVEDHTHYHIESPKHDVPTVIRHLEFSRRNRYKGNL